MPYGRAGSTTGHDARTPGRGQNIRWRPRRQPVCGKVGEQPLEGQAIAECERGVGAPV
jgi:hypothetical protein